MKELAERVGRHAFQRDRIRIRRRQECGRGRDRRRCSFLDLSELEHHAAHRWDVDFLHVPGLLQTEDYSRALFSRRVPELPKTELEFRVRHRMQRRVVIEEPQPIPMWRWFMRQRCGSGSVAGSPHVLSLRAS